MLTVSKDGKYVNLKRIGENALQIYVLEAIKNNDPKKYEVVDYYFKKYKFKPHKTLNGEMSFIECAMKYDFAMLTKYVPDIDIRAPGYNVINACVMGKQHDLLKKYIKKKGVNLNEFINGETPLITAVKQKNKEIFDILLDNNCYMQDMDEACETPLSLVQQAIIKDINDKVGNKNADFYLHAIRRLLPIDVGISFIELLDPTAMLKSVYLNFLTSETFPMNQELKKMYQNEDTLKHIMKKYNVCFSGYEPFYMLDMVGQYGTIFAKEIIRRRPYLLLYTHNKKKIIRHLCSTGDDEFIGFLVDDYIDIIRSVPESVYALLLQEKIDWVKKIIEIDNNFVHKKSEDDKNYIEYILLTNSDTTFKIEAIEYFKSVGLDPAYSDDSGSTALSIVIQYGDSEMFKYILQHFTPEKIKQLNDISKNIYMTCPITQACHYEKPEFVKLLVKQGFPIIMSDANEVPMPACATTIVFRNNSELMQYIIECPDFKIEREQKEQIFDIAKTNKCSNKILSMFDDSYEEIEDTIDEDVLRLNGILSSYFMDYMASLDRDNFDKNYRIISCLKTIALVVLKIIKSDPTRTYKSSFFDTESKCFKKYYIPEKDPRTMFIILLDFLNIQYDIRGFQLHILDKIMNGDGICIEHIKIYRDELQIYLPDMEKMEDKLNKLYRLLTDCEEEKNNENDDYENICDCCKHKLLCPDCGEFIDEPKQNHELEEPQYCQLVSTKPANFKSLPTQQSFIHAHTHTHTHTHTHSPDSPDIQDLHDINDLTEIVRIFHSFKLDISNITSLLSRITYPFECGNYQLLFDLLSKDAMYTEQDNKFNIYEGGKAVAVIYKNNKSDIPRWIKHYGYNICSEEKLDKNHMFPFAIDILLQNLWNTKKIKCGYSNTESSTKIYIYGKIYTDNQNGQAGRWIRGYFEYFLNDKDILFHRLFKPLNMKTFLTV
jgi:ankyrin repeat protein